MPEHSEKQIWFPAKRYGWGWGLPCAWQGWVMLFLWFLVLPGMGFALMSYGPELSLVVALVINAIMVVIFRRKSEKPGWRWSKG